MVEIAHQEFRHCDLLKVSGRIDSYTAPQLADALTAIISARRYKIVIDMEKVDYMSSAGMRALISAQKACRRYNRGEVVLCNVPARICEALELAGFTPLFKFFNDVTAAIGYF